MFGPTFRAEPQPRWGAATSPSPAAAVGRHRTPRDDAPAFDPRLWKNTDNAYITTLAKHIMTHQPPASSAAANPALRTPQTKPPLQTFLASSWKETPAEEATARLSKFHAVYDRRPATVVGRFLQFLSSRLFGRWHEEVRPADVMALPTVDLLHLLQLALAAGEVDRSAMLARELSRRRLALQMEAIPSAPATTTTTAASPSVVGGSPSVYEGRLPHLPASSLPHPVDSESYSHLIPPQQQRQQQRPLPPPQPPLVRRWNATAAAGSGRPSWSLEQSERSTATDGVGEYARLSRPVSVERTALWNEEDEERAVPRGLSPTMSGGVSSPYMSDIGLSSVRTSTRGSEWQSSPSWSPPWAASGAQSPY